jgi:hypothetical protein
MEAAMRSAAAEISRRLIAFVAVGALGLGACIIGPKQDDPEPTGLTADTGIAEFNDSTAGGGLDTGVDVGDKTPDSSVPATDTGTQTMDGCDKSDADAGDGACGDADAGDTRDGGDAVSDAIGDAVDGG